MRFNLFVAPFLFISLLAMEWLGAPLAEPGEDYVKPATVVVGVLLFFAAINAIYTFGWLVELKGNWRDIEHRKAYRVKAYHRARAVTSLLATFPAWIALILRLLHPYRL